MPTSTATLEFGLLERLTDQLVCSRCLKSGKRRPVTQVVSNRHRPRTLCHACIESDCSMNTHTPLVLDFERAWLSGYG